MLNDVYVKDKGLKHLYVSENIGVFGNQDRNEPASIDKIVDKFDLPVTVTMISVNEFESWGDEVSFLKHLRKNAPEFRGFIRVSEIKFNRESNRAEVEVDFVCSGLCGSGHWFRYKKENGKWEIEEGELRWIS